MSVALLAPLGLVALAAWALPVLIHLVRRLELSTTEFAALRWVSERVRPRRRLRFERPWLLLLRLVLLALLALLLARPILLEAVASTKPWVVVAPGVDRASALAAAPGLDADWHWLGAGFPAFDGRPASADVPFASLLRELDARQPAGAKITVVVPEELGGLDGERPRLVHAIDWRVVSGRMADADAAASTAPIRFAVRYAPEAQSSLVPLSAAVAAWNLREPGRYLLDARPLDVPIPADAQWLAWLAPQATPAVLAWIERGGAALLAYRPGATGDALWRDARGRVLARVEPSGQGRMIALPGALAPAALPLLLDADFPDRLHAALRGPGAAPTRARADAMRPGRVDAAVGDLRGREDDRPLDTWLALAIAALFLIERIVATRARRDSST